MYAIEAEPSSVYLWFLLMTYDREAACGAHKTREACTADGEHRCIFFDDILGIINSGGGDSGGVGEGGDEGSGAGSASAGAGAAASRGSGGNGSASATAAKSSMLGPMPASRTGGGGGGGAGEVFEFDRSALAAALASQRRPGALASGSAAGAALRRQLAEQLHSHHLQVEGLLREQLTLRQQQRLMPAFFRQSAAQAAVPPVPPPPVPPAARAGAPTPPPAADKNGSASAAAGGESAAGTSSSGGGSGGKKDDVVCTSTDLLENYLFTRSAYSNPLQAPLAMHCPGSKAHDLIKCMRILTKSACRAASECVLVPATAAGEGDMCVSRHVASLDADKIRRFTFDVALAEPSALGSCDGACWLRQAMLCNRTSGSAACSALSFCRNSGPGPCTPRLYTQDAFGSSVQEYMGECVDVDNQADCEALSLRLVHKGTYTEWSMPRTPTAQCPVPSIGGLLGSESDVVARLITTAGAREERAAEMQAAVAAAAAATNAAKMASGRGPGVLRQVYFKASDDAGGGS